MVTSLSPDVFAQAWRGIEGMSRGRRAELIMGALRFSR
jgi:hypothetical protein